MRELTNKIPRGQDRGPHFARACAVEMHLDVSQEAFYAEFYGKNDRAQLKRNHTLCEPARSKCNRTFH